MFWSTGENESLMRHLDRRREWDTSSCLPDGGDGVGSGGHAVRRPYQELPASGSGPSSSMKDVLPATPDLHASQKARFGCRRTCWWRHLALTFGPDPAAQAGKGGRLRP